MSVVTLRRRVVAEAIGTFALVAIGPGAAMVAARTHAFGHSGVALAFGLAVTLIVASSGHLGGSHVNPAVTVGFWSVRRFEGREVLPYIIAQCLVAIVAFAASRCRSLPTPREDSPTTRALAWSAALAVLLGGAGVHVEVELLVQLIERFAVRDRARGMNAGVRRAYWRYVDPNSRSSSRSSR